MNSIPDEQLLEMVASTSCEITAVVVPTKANNFIGISMYSDDKAVAKRLPVNQRATTLSKNCGHALAEIRGDVFISRYHDDEMADIWERINFTIADASPRAKWMKKAIQKGGGGGSGSTTANAPSLSNTMNQMMTANGGGAAAPGSADDLNAAADAAETRFKWNQIGEEVEVLINLPKGTKAKDLNVKFTSSNIDVALKATPDAPLVEGKLFSAIVSGDSTYTIADSVLTITLCKRDAGCNWVSPIIV
jgi:hypothetical protein